MTSHPVRTFDAWCDTLVSLGDKYEGIVLATNVTNNPQPKEPGPPVQQGSSARTFSKASSRVNFRYSLSNAKKVDAQMAKARIARPASAMQPAQPSGGAGKPTVPRTPSDPCKHCGGPHFSTVYSKRPAPSRPCRHCSGSHYDDLCPKRFPHRSQQVVPAACRVTTQASNTTVFPDDPELFDVAYVRRITHANSASQSGCQHGRETTDGMLIVHDVLVPFVIDIGATHSCISMKHAKTMTRHKDVTCVKLAEPITVTIADGKQLQCSHRLIMPASLVFNDGTQATLRLTELLAVSGLSDGEVLIGRKTLKVLGVDIINMTKAALLYNQLCSTTSCS